MSASIQDKDELVIGGHKFTSRFILGSGKYSYDLIDSAINNAKAQIITMALRRNTTGSEKILNFIPENITILPNTSGSTTA
ncbi:MAG: thiazole synthase, partial [Lentilactobacillus hilgardii]